VVSRPKLNLTPHLSQPRKLEGYHHKDKIHFSCDVGYYLVGSPLLTCLVNGKWSSHPPTCKGNLKGHLALMSNVNVQCNKKN
jgi:hypothetical protein